MSANRSTRGRKSPPTIRRTAGIFAALGDNTRLRLVTTLAAGESRSITELSAESRLTRQAITKHLRVLENVGFVSSEKTGREVRFRFSAAPMNEASNWLASVSVQWDQALNRLQSFVHASSPLRSDGH